jgi:hypothetical protein
MDHFTDSPHNAVRHGPVSGTGERPAGRAGGCAAEPIRKQRPRGRRHELAAWLEREKPAIIGEREWDEVRSLLAPVSESYLRHLLRDAGVPLTALVEGVRQESFDALEASLLKLLEEYENGDRSRQVLVRRLVIAAKDHARWAARKEEKRPEKEEMVLWMTTWLENPPLFRDWIQLRRRWMSGR